MGDWPPVLRDSADVRSRWLPIAAEGSTAAGQCQGGGSGRAVLLDPLPVAALFQGRPGARDRAPWRDLGLSLVRCRFVV